MTEYSRFFDSTTYTEAQWNEYHRALVAHNGYVAGKANELAVTQSTPAAMTVEVDTGEALVQGAWYQNSASKTMTIEAADASYNRIDRIVTRLSFTANSIILAVLKGTAAASPAAPTLTQNATTWELSIAQIAVAAAAASIVTANITDQRLTSACGVAACNLGEMYIDNDGTLVTSGKAIIMGTAKITGLGDPGAAQDAATQAYVLTKAWVSGMIGLWSGAVSAIPTGFVFCNGSNSTPDLRGKFVIGAESDSGGTYDVGDTGGEATHVLITAEMPAHTHSGGNAGNVVASSAGSVAGVGVTGSTGGDGAHNNMPPYYALAYIMKT